MRQNFLYKVAIYFAHAADLKVGLWEMNVHVKSKVLSQLCLLPHQLHIFKQHGSIILHSKVIKTFLEYDGNAIHTAENEVDEC